MTVTIPAGRRTGCVRIPASKSQAHRLLICAALAKTDSVLVCDGISKDIAATIACLNALGADIQKDGEGKLRVHPIRGCANGETKHLFCGESGSTLRFLIGVVGALGETAIFHMEGKLPSRPVDALTDVLCDHGMKFEHRGSELLVSGRLTAGSFEIPGNISSQYISGLLFALPLLEGNSTLTVTGNIESESYIRMTERAVLSSGIRFTKKEQIYTVPGRQSYLTEEMRLVEADWSNAAFFLCMGAMSEKGVSVQNLPLQSAQGDAQILQVLRSFGSEVETDEACVTVRRKALRGITVDARQIPDLVPTICALAAGAEGTTKIINAERLRLKESDRLATTAGMLAALGAEVLQTEDGLIIHGKPSLPGGTADAANDHRIAMAAAVAAGHCRGCVTVTGAQCVDKSYPGFWADLEMLEVTQ